MNRTVRVLNRLLALHSRSLPSYVGSAWPHTSHGDQRACETLRHIIADHQTLVDHIANVIRDEDGTVSLGAYPMEFTDLHDLSMEFILRQVKQRQERDIVTIEACAAELQDHPRGYALAQEALGAAKGHLQSLSEVLNGSAMED